MVSGEAPAAAGAARPRGEDQREQFLIRRRVGQRGHQSFIDQILDQIGGVGVGEIRRRGGLPAKIDHVDVGDLGMFDAILGEFAEIGSANKAGQRRYHRRRRWSIGSGQPGRAPEHQMDVGILHHLARTVGRRR